MVKQLRAIQDKVCKGCVMVYTCQTVPCVHGGVVWVPRCLLVDNLIVGAVAYIQDDVYQGHSQLDVLPCGEYNILHDEPSVTPP